MLRLAILKTFPEYLHITRGFEVGWDL